MCLYAIAAPFTFKIAVVILRAIFDRSLPRIAFRPRFRMLWPPPVIKPCSLCMPNDQNPRTSQRYRRIATIRRSRQDGNRGMPYAFVVSSTSCVASNRQRSGTGCNLYRAFHHCGSICLIITISNNASIKRQHALNHRLRTTHTHC